MAKKKKYTDLEENRYGIFMHENSYQLDIEYGQHYLETDVVYIIYVHKINIIESQVDDLYNQAKAHQKQFFPPVKINAMVNVEDATQEYYGNNEGGIVREDTGKLRVSVYLQELDKHNLEIDRGDILEWNQSGERSRYYEVENANNVVDTTKQTIAGFKPYWKVITAVPVKEDVVPFLKGDSFR